MISVLKYLFLCALMYPERKRTERSERTTIVVGGVLISATAPPQAPARGMVGVFPPPPK